MFASHSDGRVFYVEYLRLVYSSKITSVTFICLSIYNIPHSCVCVSRHNCHEIEVSSKYIVQSGILEGYIEYRILLKMEIDIMALFLTTFLLLVGGTNTGCRHLLQFLKKIREN